MDEDMSKRFPNGLWRKIGMAWRGIALGTLMGLALPGLAVPKQAQAAAPAILILGDSLSAEYGIARGAGWVKLMEDRLRAEGFDYSVVNASISGETTVGGKTRLPDLLARHKPEVVVVELGANDALRGLPLQNTEANLREMVQRSQKAKARVLLVGMRIPPNYGQDYTERFFNIYPRLASEAKVPLVPFLLEGIVSRPDWFQSDRVHPTAQAQKTLLDTVWPQLEPLLKSSASRR